jgi:Spy/CpxP family protein refolding chaperone
MNRIVSTAVFASLLAGSLAFAQAPQTPAANPQQPAAHAARTPNPHRQAVHIARQLSLTPDQSAKLEPIFADRDQKIAALRANTSLQPQDARKQMRAIRENTQQQLSAVLTPDQLQQLKAMRQAHSHRGQPQAAATPTA